MVSHGDCHLANILRDSAGSYRLIDWNDALLAPPERDLTFYTGVADRFGPFLDVYLDTYDPGLLDPDIFAFYIYQWCVSEIGSYTHRILCRNPGTANDEQNESDLSGFREYVPIQQQRWMESGIAAVADVLRQRGISTAGR